jgi:hypothetical protein
MDVKEFVSDMLKQIIDGVVDVQNNTSAVVVPHSGTCNKINFDIAVTVVESKESGGKAGISVYSIGAGVTGKTESSSSTVSRIKFEIPVELPKGDQVAYRQRQANNKYGRLSRL